MPKCRIPNCLVKRAMFNFPSEKQGVCCGKHKENTMIDLFRDRCNNENCSKQPVFNFPNENKRLFCNQHKKDGMINIKDKNRICEFDVCKKRPNFNFKGEEKPKFCTDHKLENMVDITHIKCSFDNCTKQPTYNYSNQRIALYCTIHKLKDMVDIKHKKCNYKDCNTRPVFNNANKNYGKFCIKHKEPNMIDVVNTNISCKQDHCSTRSSNPKYRGYCLRCFMYTFPDEPVTRNYKIKEKHVAEFIDQEFNVHNPIYDKVVQGGCSKRRPDILIDLFSHSIIIEIDEEQHEDYICENKRMMQLFEDLGNRPIVFIRFNPDSYVDIIGKKHLSCFSYHKLTGIPIISSENRWNQRLNKLKTTIEKYTTVVPDKEISIEQLFYNLNI
jgi:hypothetical protein